MDRPHCDRCDTIIEPYPSWVEVLGRWADTGDKHVVHIQTSNNNSHRPPQAFCLRCWVWILRTYCDQVATTMATVMVPADPAAVKASAKRMLKKHAKAFKKLASARRPVKRKAHAMP